MSVPIIPGLCRIPVEGSSPDDNIELTSFDLKMFKVPGAHRLGKCRPISEFERLCRIGEGMYGIVYKVKDKKSGKIFALKKLKIDQDSPFLPQNFLREISNLKLLKHENIVNLIETAVGQTYNSTFLVFEYCKYSLSRVIDDDPGYLYHPQIKLIMHQLFTGLDFIHRNGVLHRDISPTNVLFNESGILKITDFGISRKATAIGKLTPNLGTLWYRAPEMLFGAENYSSAVDIWSAGCILSEMLLEKKALFSGDSILDIIKRIIDVLGSPTENLWPGHLELPLLKDYSLQDQPYNQINYTFASETTETVSLLKTILLYNPQSRSSAKQCLGHPYFSEFPEACSPEELLLVLQASETI